MESHNKIAGNMEKIAAIFQDAQKYASTQDNIDQLIHHLESYDSEFKSIAFEGASMELALKSFSLNDGMALWNSYMKAAGEHQTQIFLGLGWAVAMNKFVPVDYLEKQDTIMQTRMWEGCGYMDGFLRKRQTVNNHLRMDYIAEKDFQNYDQGLGRRLWYLQEGYVAKVKEVINGFPADRHSALWRGIAMACSYVGGCSEDTYHSISEACGNYKIDLAIGAAMIAKSRLMADLPTPELEMACKIWCNKTPEKAMSIVVSEEAMADYTYNKFINRMESVFVIK
jgi:hypothetical protein